MRIDEEGRDLRCGPVRAFGVGLGAAFVFVVALGLANGLALVAASAGAPSVVNRLLQAVVCAAVALVGVGWLVRRAGADLAWAGLRRTGVGRDLVTGLVVVLGSAAVVFGPAVALGGIRIAFVSGAELALFLLLTVVVATGQEAFPEELVFRGLAFSSLRAGLPRALAAVVATVFFVLSVGASQVVTSLVVRLAGVGEPPWYLPVPAGETPAIYLPFLILWSICLLCARLVSGSIWTGVSAHLMLLIVNRVLLGRDTGLAVELASPDLLLLVPAYVVLATVVFALLARRR